MIVKRTTLSDALSELSDERIEEALELDSAEALRRAGREEKALRNEMRSRKYRRWLAVPVCAALCLALLPVCLRFAGRLAGNRPGETNVQVANPWIYVDSAADVAARMHTELPALPAGKTARQCAVLQPEERQASSMGDIIFTDGSRLRLVKTEAGAEPSTDQMARYSGYADAEWLETETLHGLRVYRFRTSAGDLAAWIRGDLYYCYEYLDREDLLELLAGMPEGRN